MKVLWSLPWVALVLAAPALGSAQVTVGEPDDGTSLQTAIRQRSSITLTSDGRTAPAASGVIPEFHSVERGDTLWDITGYYFNNPWRWPQVWARNPQITNPHWIFPGDQVRLLLAGEVTAITPRRNTPAGVTLGSGRNGPGVRPRLVPRGTVFLREEAWLAPEDIEGAGAIVGSPEDQMLLSEGDQMYIEFDRRAPRIGDTYTIYQEAHPALETDRDGGRVVRVLGSAVIDAWDPAHKIATARIIESIDPIERGERVALIQRSFAIVPPRTNDRSVRGQIVATAYPRELVGGDQVVFVNRGRADGVQPGNRFFILARGDAWRVSGGRTSPAIDRDGDGSADNPPGPDERSQSDLPSEAIGELVIVAVHERTSAALVTMSSTEISVGQAVLMRQGY